MYKNKVGLEAEYFLRNSKGDLILPSKKGFTTDEYIILGEFRGDPGTTREETIANFMKEYYGVVRKAQKAKVNIDLTGYAVLDVPFHAQILREMGMKEISQSLNIYGTDILQEVDAKIEESKIVGYYASTGLHVHFSSSDEAKYEFTLSEPVLERVSLPLSVGDMPVTMELWKKTGETPRKVSGSATANRITKPVLRHIVEQMDTLLPQYVSGFPELKFRKPGFYEHKTHNGFEYRSLPFSTSVLADIYNIVDFAFNLLEEL